MKKTEKNINGSPVSITEFNSISDLISYIKTGKTSIWFEGYCQSNLTDASTKEFTNTGNLKEAMDMLENGWYEEAKKIEARFKKLDAKPLNGLQRKFVQDVVGFQPIVPNYMMGLPNSMVNSKMVVRKQKVVTLNMSMTYSGAVKADVIESCCLTALRVVKAIEDSGCRVNLNVYYAGWNPDYATGTTMYNLIKLKVKGANERLNISKVCFPMVHPSMLRRIFFKVIEVTPSFTREYRKNYGKVVKDDDIKNTFSNLMKGEYFIPTFLRDKDIETSSSVYDCLIRM